MKQKSKSILKCIMTFVLTIAMVFGAVPLPFMPGSMVAQAADKTLSGDESYTAKDGDVLTGSTSGTVKIADNANITLNNATITGGIVCEGSAVITLVGENDVKVTSLASNLIYQTPGIKIGGSGTTLTIKGDGSLTATGGSASAGIGLGRTWDANATGGSIVIESGNITASGDIGIGIGTVGNSKTASLDDIIIKGGTVNASLGSGYIYSVSSVTISTITIYDGIDKVDASKITTSVTYMHVENETETDVTASASTYFTIIENGDRRIITPKDNTDYTITIAGNTEHGTIVCAATTAKYADKITITATPDFGYRLSSLVVKDAQNKSVASTGNSFFMPKSNVTVSAVFEQGTHGTTEFAWGNQGDYYQGFVKEATIYDGVTTVNLQTSRSYSIGKYDELNSYAHLLIDNDVYQVFIPYSGGTGTFVQGGTSFSLANNATAGFYDVTMNEAGNGKWSVSIKKTVPAMDDVPDQEYTGSEITPEPLVLAGSLNLTKGTDYEYSYDANTNAGTAKVIVTFKGDYVSLGSMEKEFTIVPHIHNFAYSASGTTITATCSKANCPLAENKPTLTIHAPTLATYGGTGSAEATLDGLDSFNSATGLNIAATSIKYVGRGDTAYTESATAPTEAGTYTASITAGSKTASVDYTIASKPISITGATATERDYKKDSTSVEISAVTFDGATLTKGTDYTVTGVMADDTAGNNKSVTVTVTLTNGNYTFGTNGNTKTTTVKINKIDHDGVTSSSSVKYGEEGTVALSSLIEAGGSLGEVSVTDTNGVLDGTPTIETDGKNLKFKFSNNSNNVGKTATVTIPVEGATNYKDYNIVVTLTVTDKTVPTLMVSNFIKIYDGNAVAISEITKTAKDGSLDVDGTWDFEGTPGLKNVSDSGTITVRFTPTDTANYESATATFMLTINRKAVTVKADNKSMVVGTTPEPELTATVSGTVGNDTVIYSLDREAGTAVGDYVITPSGDTLQGNYTVSYETGTFTITEDTTAPVVKKAPKAITGLVYNGTAQALVEPGEAENGTMYYAVTTENTAPADNLYTASNYTSTNAGTYYVWYKVVGDDNLNNSEAEKVTVTISQLSIKNATVSLDETDLVYTGSEQSVQVSSVKIGETVLKANSEYEVSGTTGTNKGDYTVTVTGKGNYKDVVTSKWNIAMATPVIDVLPSASVITYGQSLADSTLTEGTAKLGENVVEGTFSWKNDATKPVVSDSEKTEYVVVFKPNDADNLNTVECKVKVTVNKAIAGVAKAPTANTLIYNGKAQALVKAGEATDGIMNFAIGKDDKTAPAEGWNISIPTATNAGTYHVWYRVVGDDNHSDSAIKTFDVTIEVPDTNKLEVSLEGWTYGEKAKQPTVKADFGADKVSYSYSDKEDGTFKADVPSSAGTWYIKATIPKTDNYPESEAIKSFEIAKADSISGAPDTSKSVDYTVDTVDKVSLPANWTWKMADINKELTVGAAVEAKAEYTGTDKDNYVDAVKTVKVSITRNACTHDNLEEVSEVPASCTKEGVLAHSKCPVCNKLFVKDDDKLVEKTADELKIEAVGHSYGKATYSWSDDHATCTATKVCMREGCDENSEGHVVTETVKTTSKTTPAGCEEKGVITYTATFTDKDFGTATDSVEIAAKGHNYVTTYEWSEDGKTCTATAVCKNDSTHKVTETAEYKADKETSKIKAAVKETATTEKMGTTTYTASFENALFAAQTKDVVDIPKVENPAENPSENPSENPAENPSENPSENPIENPAENPSENPSQGGQDNPQQGNDSSQDNKKSEQTAADKPQEIVTDKSSEKTADTPATPVENKTTTVVKEEGTTIPVADNKAEVVVTSKPGEEPSVAYKGTTDESAKAIEIPETVVSNGVTYAVTEISEGAFENNKTVESVKLGDNITTLGENAFAGCTNLKSVELPKNIKELPKGAFKDCTSLKKVDIPKNVKKIGDKTFSGCSKLATMNLKNNVTEIGENAFEGCTSLKKVTLGKNVTKIGGKAFNGAKKLRTITIQSKKLTKKSVKGAFKGSKINTIKIDTGSKAQNKKLVKKYKKIFTKKNTGRKVIIK